MTNILQQTDPEVWQAIQGERRRQQQGLEMIASENYTSPAVMAAQGSVLTNKYAEGYPGRRYYGARPFRSPARRRPTTRVLQRLAPAKANSGGLVAAELHPDPVPVSDFVTSTTHKTLRGPRAGFVLCKKDWIQKINSSVFPGIQGGPLMHVIAAKAVAFGEALKPEFRTYQQQIVKNAAALAGGLMKRGLTLCSGGTDNHLMLVDLRQSELTGKMAEET